jgi:polar amino acid transport system permease protein
VASEQLRVGIPPVAGRGDDVADAVRRIRPSRIVLLVVIAILAAQFVTFLVTNKRFGWSVVRHYLFNHLILQGLLTTIELTAISMTLGILIGIAVAVARLSTFRPVSTLAWLYTRFFFGVPLLVQLIFWFNLAYLVPKLSIGLPFGPSYGDWSANQIITPFIAAVLGLALHEGGYMSEVIRAGLMSVDRGQRDAARTLGLSSFQTLRRILLPQALRFIVPPTTNQVIGMLKGSALVSAVGVADLTGQVENIYNINFQIVPLLLVACIWYFVLISILDVVQRYTERRFARADAGSIARGTRQRPDAVATNVTEAEV